MPLLCNKFQVFLEVEPCVWSLGDDFIVLCSGFQGFVVCPFVCLVGCGFFCNCCPCFVVQVTMPPRQRMASCRGGTSSSGVYHYQLFHGNQLLPNFIQFH